MRTNGIIISSKRINDWDRLINVVSNEGVFPYIIKRGIHYSSPFLSVFTTYSRVDFLWDFAKSGDFRLIYDYLYFKHNTFASNGNLLKKDLLFELLRKYLTLQNISFIKNEYEIFKNVFEKLFNSTNNFKGLYYSFLLAVLKENGVFPEIDSCAICGKKIPNPKYFSIENGGIICDKCREINVHYYRIDGLFIKSLRFAERNHIKILDKSNWNYDILKNFDIIKKYYYYHYKELK